MREYMVYRLQAVCRNLPNDKIRTMFNNTEQQDGKFRCSVIAVTAWIIIEKDGASADEK